MSTLTGEQESRLLESEVELYAYFQRFAKTSQERRVGIECEFFGVDRDSGEALAYSGPCGIEAILRRLAETFCYEPVLEDGHVIALKRQDTWITLEPGAQVELSAPPVRTIYEIEEQLANFRFELREMEAEFPGIAWLSVGSHPFSPVDRIEWVPKKRYSLMAQYLGSRGRLAHEMMKATATNQVSFDFQDESSALDQFRVIMGISSITSALFAHSPISLGKPNGFLTRRVYVWQDTDPDRSGLLPDFLNGGRSFRDYVEYLLEMPMIFIVRGQKWVAMEGLSFRKFLCEGKGVFRATWGDFELHLSTVFPEVRFKQYLEIRGVDAQPFQLIPSVSAFWKGIVYDEEIRKKVWGLVAPFTPTERLEFHRQVPQKGLKAFLGKTPALELAREITRLSKEGLKRQAGSAGVDESFYLERLEDEILKPGQTPAETLLERWAKGRHENLRL